MWELSLFSVLQFNLCEKGQIFHHSCLSFSFTVTYTVYLIGVAYLKNTQVKKIGQRLYLVAVYELHFC